MAQLFDIVVENAVLSAKSTILEEAAGTPAGDRYVYIVEAAGDTLKKAKEFIVKNKGKLAALAGLAALGGAGYYAHTHGLLAEPSKKAAEFFKDTSLGNKLNEYSQEQIEIQKKIASDNYADAVDKLNKLGINPHKSDENNYSL